MIKSFIISSLNLLIEDLIFFFWRTPYSLSELVIEYLYILSFASIKSFIFLVK